MWCVEGNPGQPFHVDILRAKKDSLPFAITPSNVDIVGVRKSFIDIVFVRASSASGGDPKARRNNICASS
jgi:hypothetical protein